MKHSICIRVASIVLLCASLQAQENLDSDYIVANSHRPITNTETPEQLTQPRRTAIAESTNDCDALELPECVSLSGERNRPQNEYSVVERWGHTYGAAYTAGSNVSVLKVQESKYGGWLLIGGNSRCGLVTRVNENGTEMFTVGFKEPPDLEKVHTITFVREISVDTIAAYGSTGYNNIGISGPFQPYRSLISSSGLIIDTIAVSVGSGFADFVNIVDVSDGDVATCYAGGGTSMPSMISKMSIDFRNNKVLSVEGVGGMGDYSTTPNFVEIDSVRYSLSSTAYKYNNSKYRQKYIVVRSKSDTTEWRFTLPDSVGGHQQYVYRDSAFYVLSVVNMSTTRNMQLAKYKLNGDVEYALLIRPDLYVIPASFRAIESGTLVITGVLGQRDSNGKPITNDEYLADGIAIALDLNGVVEWVTVYEAKYSDIFRGACSAPNNKVIVYGGVGYGGQDVESKLYVRMIEILASEVVEKEGCGTLSVSPNPCKNVLNIEMCEQMPAFVRLIITDVCGRVIKETSVECNGDYKRISADVRDLHEGCYLASIVSDKFKSSAYFILHKN